MQTVATVEQSPERDLGSHNPLKQAKHVFDGLDVKESTKQDYKQRIGLFFEFVGGRQIDHDIFLRYKRYLSECEDYGVAAKNKYLTSARVFLKELHRRGVLPVDITQNVKGFSESRKHKTFGLDAQEYEQLLDHLESLEVDTLEQARLKALLFMLVLQGLRQVEVVRLNVDDISFDNRVVYIHGKGRDDKERVHLHPKTFNALHEYVGRLDSDDGPLFVSLSNNSYGERLTTRGVRRIVTDALDELDIDRTTHGLRHFFVTRLARQFDGDPFKVIKFSRHRSIETLQVYFDEVQLEEDLPAYYEAFAA